MTPLQDAFNQGVAAATVLIRFAASQYPKNYGLPPDALSAMADALDALKHADPEPSAPAAEVEAMNGRPMTACQIVSEAVTRGIADALTSGGNNPETWFGIEVGISTAVYAMSNELNPELTMAVSNVLAAANRECP